MNSSIRQNLILPFVLSFVCSFSYADLRADPEKATGLAGQELVVGKTHMVVAANPLAAKLGFDQLQRGGTAIDAAIAIQAGLTMVEPQSSGIGGGAFILYWDAKSKKMHTYDARETAPENATSELFVENGKVLSWREAIVGGKSVGVPGVLKGLNQAHEQHGKLAWNSLFDGAIKLAKDGFAVSPRMAKLVAYKMHPGLLELEPAKSYFYPNGEGLTAGTWIKNPELANSLSNIAKHGVEYFYEGALAKKIVDRVNTSPIRPGTLSLSDMKNYQAVERDAICGDYRAYTLCGMGQPSSGGLTTLQIFKFLENYDIPAMGQHSADAWHVFTQASRLAFADRGVFAGDPAFIDIPVKALMAPAYIKQRSSLIDMNKDMGKASAGDPVNGLALAKDDSYELPNTSHISIVDQFGNVLSMTTSIEMGFGSSLMVGGFLLNNQLTDFSLSPKRDGKLVGNRVEPGKRPRSSMSPFIVFNKKDHSVKASLGSPGGSRIINYVAKAMVGILDWDLNIQQAIELPNVTNRNDYTALEKGMIAPAIVDGLKAKGHAVKVQDMNSGLHGIVINGGQLEGGADPRREGKVYTE